MWRLLFPKTTGNKNKQWTHLGALKNLKLFSIRVKDLFQPIVLGRKGDAFFFFLKAFSWKTDLE